MTPLQRTQHFELDQDWKKFCEDRLVDFVVSCRLWVTLNICDGSFVQADNFPDQAKVWFQQGKVKIYVEKGSVIGRGTLVFLVFDDGCYKRIQWTLHPKP